MKSIIKWKYLFYSAGYSAYRIIRNAFPPICLKVVSFMTSKLLQNHSQRGCNNHKIMNKAFNNTDQTISIM